MEAKLNLRQLSHVSIVIYTVFRYLIRTETITTTPKKKKKVLSGDVLKQLERNKLLH